MYEIFPPQFSQLPSHTNGFSKKRENSFLVDSKQCFFAKKLMWFRYFWEKFLSVAWVCQFANCSSVNSNFWKTLSFEWKNESKQGISINGKLYTNLSVFQSIAAVTNIKTCFLSINLNWIKWNSRGIWKCELIRKYWEFWMRRFWDRIEIFL